MGSFDLSPFSRWPSPPFSFEEQVEVILQEGVPVFSFTFGILPRSLISRFQQSGTLVYGTATTPEEAEELEKLGVDAIVCQGQEAGGHRGNFSSDDPLYSLSTLLMLIKERVETPLIAAGGIMNGSSVAAAFLLGAEAVQMGTAFITTTESGAPPAYKEALLKRSGPPTVLTKAFTGKLARAVMNPFIKEFEGGSVPPYPIQHFLTHPLRTLAAREGCSDLIALWAGQGYPLCRALSAKELIDELRDYFP